MNFRHNRTATPNCHSAVGQDMQYHCRTDQAHYFPRGPAGFCASHENGKDVRSIAVRLGREGGKAENASPAQGLDLQSAP